MKRALVSVFVAGLATLALSAESFAGANADARILLHILGTTTKGACTRLAATPGCQSIITQGALYPSLYYTHVLVTDANAPAGVAGVQFGIQYTGPGATDHSGVDIYAWTLCATLEFLTPSPAWPNSGAGTLITWDATTRCQRFEPNGPGTGVVANAGYFYMAAYGPGTMGIIPRPIDGFAKVADCAAQEDVVEGVGTPRTPSHLGLAGFGGQTGYNPCGIIDPVEATTWSGVKSLARPH
jgi:hypothetical protein